LAWVERNVRKTGAGDVNSKLISGYLNSGRPRELLNQALADVQPLTTYEEDLLRVAQVEVEKSRRFFELAKAILRPTRFVAILAEAKGDALEGRQATKNPTARIIWRIREAISSPVPTTSSVKS
jgi:hypothetical protein